MATLVRWDPLREAAAMHTELSRVMNGLLSAFDSVPPKVPRSTGGVPGAGNRVARRSVPVAYE